MCNEGEVRLCEVLDLEVVICSTPLCKCHRVYTGLSSRCRGMRSDFITLGVGERLCCMHNVTLLLPIVRNTDACSPDELADQGRAKQTFCCDSVQASDSVQALTMRHTLWPLCVCRCLRCSAAGAPPVVKFTPEEGPSASVNIFNIYVGRVRHASSSS
jgi:hypothetical protein